MLTGAGRKLNLFFYVSLSLAVCGQSASTSAPEAVSANNDVLNRAAASSLQRDTASSELHVQPRSSTGNGMHERSGNVDANLPLSKHTLSQQFFKRRNQEGTDFFEGAVQMLEGILAFDTDDSNNLAPKVHLGFAYLYEQSYGHCAHTFSSIAKAMGDRTKGPSFLAAFCECMVDGRNLDAVVPLRQALTAMEDDNLDDEWLELAKDLLHDLDALFWNATQSPADDDATTQPNIAPEWYVPGLTARPFHETSWLTAAQVLEASSEMVCAEVDAFVSGSGASKLQPVGAHTDLKDADLVRKGMWSDYNLFYAGVANRHACENYFPGTCALIINHLPDAWTNRLSIVSVSQLLPGTETILHRGQSNFQITLHLGVQTPEEAGIRVGSQIRQPGWQRGKLTVFDDSYEHQVWHRGLETAAPRVVLIVRVWHPEFTLAERIEYTKWDRLRPKHKQLDAQDYEKRIKHMRSAAAAAHWSQANELFRSQALRNVSSVSGRLEL